MAEYLIGCGGVTYIQVDLVWRIIIALLIGITLIHTVSLSAVLLCKFAAHKFSLL